MIRIAVDFGARFADVIAWGPQDTQIIKQPMRCSPADTLGAALCNLGLRATQIDEIRIATTAPLNALIRKQRARVALLTNRGFSDTLELGRQNRIALYDPVARSNAPVFMVDPADIYQIGGRHDADGTEVAPIPEADFEDAINALQARPVDAVAICFLFAHLTPDHEFQVAQAIREVWPNLPISLSHQVDPAPREYERTVSTVLDAWLTATVVPDLRAIGDLLSDQGFTGTIRYGDGRGVLVPNANALNRPATVLSGGPAAVARAAAPLVPQGNCISLDVGSRTADISLIADGQIATVDPAYVAGITLRHAIADTTSVQRGGASVIEWTDMKHSPEQPRTDAATLDDALHAIGRIAEPDTNAAERITAIAKGLGLDPANFAEECVTKVEAGLAAEITRFATRRNVDPTRSELVISGGTGALLAAGIARLTGLSKVRLPIAPAAAGALGLMIAPGRIEASERIDRALPDISADALDQVCSRLEEKLTERETIAETYHAPVWSVSIAARPEMHAHALSLSMRPGTTHEPAADIAESFALFYQDRFGVAPPGPGHLFQISVSRDTQPATLASCFTASTRCTETGQSYLQHTAAGSIWVPSDWHLSMADGEYILSEVPA